MSIESPLIPNPIKGELSIQIKLPDEASLLLQDLHNDRQHIGLGVAIVVLALVAVAVKYVLRTEG